MQHIEEGLLERKCAGASLPPRLAPLACLNTNTPNSNTLASTTVPANRD